VDCIRLAWDSNRNEPVALVKDEMFFGFLGGLAVRFSRTLLHLVSLVS
jgi:hypothetical protein